MNIRTKVRELLLEAEKKKHKNEFGCVMIFLDIAKKDWDGIQDEIEEEDLYTDPEDPSYGREMEPHVTILYGLHGDIPDEEIEEEIKKIKMPEIEFKGISSFDSKEFDVLKFDVKSSDLTKLNKKFAEFPHTSKFPDYHPHCTIAYLKKDSAKKYVDKLKDKATIKFKASHIVYSKVDGTKKNYPLK